MPRVFQTLRVGCAHAHGWASDVRLVSDGDAYFVVCSGTLEDAFPDLEAALLHAAERFPTLVWRTNLVPGDDESPCPTCRAPTTKSPRYPRALCPVCVLEAVDAEGRSLTFHNTSLSGGFIARRADGTTSEEHACFVRGVSCHADEAYFGGIVVNRVDA